MSSLVDETDGAGAFSDPAQEVRPLRGYGRGQAQRRAGAVYGSRSGNVRADRSSFQQPRKPSAAAPPKPAARRWTLYGRAHFDPERRALNGPGRLPSEAPVQAEAPPPEPPLALAGILASGDMRKALFAGPDTRLPEGATAFGWHVVEVEPRRVTVRRGGEERILDASDALRR